MEKKKRKRKEKEKKEEEPSQRLKEQERKHLTNLGEVERSTHQLSQPHYALLTKIEKDWGERERREKREREREILLRILIK